MGYQLELGLIKAHKGGNRIFSYYASEEEEQESGLGRIFIILEILSKDKNLFAIGPELVAVLKDTFYHSPSSSIEASVELACQKANSYFLSEPIDHFKLYSKISAVVFATHEEQLSLAHVNNGSLLLVRKGKISPITERLPLKTKRGEKPKLFTTITTGVLEVGDTILASTRPLVDFLSEEKIKSILKQLKTPDAGMTFADDIQRIPSPLGFEGVIIKCKRGLQTEMKVIPTAHIEKQTVVESLSELEALESKTNKLLSLSSWSTLKKKIGALIGSFTRPKAKIVTSVKGLLASQKTAPQMPQAEPPIRRPILPAGLSQNLFLSPFERIKKLFMGRSRYLTFGIILLVLFLITTMLQTKQVPLLPFKNPDLSVIEEALSQAEIALIYQNEELARERLLSAKNSFTTLAKRENETTRTIAKQILTLEQRLYLITPVSPELVVDFGNNEQESTTTIVNKGIFTFQGKLYGITNTPFRLLEIHPTEKRYTPITLDSSLNTFQAIGASADTKGIFASDGTAIHYLDLEGKKSLLSTTLPSSVFVSYANRLYAVSGNLLYRLDKQKNSISRAPWITDGSTLNGVLSMAIDGDIFLGTPEGILKYTKGKRQEFSTPPLDIALVPTALSTNLDSKNLFVLDREHKRIVIISKSGGLVKQLDLTMQAPPDGFVVDEIKKIIYLSAGNAIWKVSY